MVHEIADPGMQGKVLLAWELGSGTGHVRNLDAVGEALRLRGVNPVYVLRTLQSVACMASAQSCRIYQAPVLVERHASYPGIAASYAELLERVGYTDTDFVSGQLMAWRSIIEAERPDCVIVDHAPGALLVAGRLGIRSVAIGTGFTIPPRDKPIPALADEVPRDRLVAVEDRVLRTVNQSLSAAGYRGIDSVAEILATDADYILSFPELDHYTQRSGGHYLGPIETAAHAARPEWPAAGSKRVFVYYHHSYPLFDWLHGQLVRSGLSCLWVAPGISLQDAQRLSSASVRVIAHPLDLGTIAREATMTICHGGHGVCAELLREGQRLLILPHYFEQAVLARSLSQQGLAVTPAAGKNELTDLIDRTLTSAQLVENIRKFVHRYRDWDPGSRLRLLLDTIEEIR